MYAEEQSSGDHVPGDWSTARNNNNNNQTSSKGGLWDDAGAAAGADALDLDDFAAMALKFRSEMEQMKLSGEADGELGGGEEDMMDRLLREQNNRTSLEEDEDEMPDWATEEVEPVVAAAPPAAKRSLLLETLNVKPAQAAAPAPAPVVQAPATVVQNNNNNYNNSVLHSSLQVPAPPPLLRVEPSQWQYTDPQGNVQGPFEQDNMRQWHEAGYFNAELPIKLSHWSGFHAFVTVFPDMKVAFLNTPSEPGSSLLLSLQQQQQQQLIRQQQLLQQQQAEEHAKQAQLKAAEQERAYRAQQLQQQHEEEQRRQLLLQQQQAAQLAQQRELQIQQQQQQQAAAEQQRAQLEHERQQAAAVAAQAAAQQKPASVAPWANKQPGPNRSSATSAQESLLAIQSEEKARADEEKRRQAAEQSKITPKGWGGATSSAGPSLAEIQQQEEQARQRQAQAEASRTQAAPATTNMSFQLKNLLGVKAAPTPAATSSGPAWGSAPAPAAASKGSLRDIMQEEETVEGIAPVKGGAASSNAPRKPLSWAAKAGSSGFSTAPAPAAAAAPRVAPRPVVSPVVAPAPAASSVKKAAPSGNKEKSDFGGKEMSKEFADWCGVQLKKLNGSDDITLMEFCMSLNSGVEVREYLSQYLGSSPAVSTRFFRSLFLTHSLNTIFLVSISLFFYFLGDQLRH